VSQPSITLSVAEYEALKAKGETGAASLAAPEPVEDTPLSLADVLYTLIHHTRIPEENMVRKLVRGVEAHFEAENKPAETKVDSKSDNE
jgi:hypothetical protein